MSEGREIDKLPQDEKPPVVSEREELPNLDINNRDYAAILLRAALGLVPGDYGSVASAVGEIVGELIPNQRVDRIAKFVKILHAKLDDVEAEVISSKMRQEEFIDLFEDGAYQAARALTDERRERIASLLANSLTRDELDHIQEKKLLSLLGDLNDAELVILKSKNFMYAGAGSEYFEKHQDVLMPVLMETGLSDEEANKHTMHETYRQTLRQLGLLRTTFKKPKKGQPPEFDEKTGMMKSGSDRITQLGNLLLDYIDMPDE